MLADAADSARQLADRLTDDLPTPASSPAWLRPLELTIAGVELTFGSVVVVASILLDALTALSRDDPHGGFFSGMLGIAFLPAGLGMCAAGFTMRSDANWRWMGQVLAIVGIGAGMLIL